MSCKCLRRPKSDSLLGSFEYRLMDWLSAWGCHGSERERATVATPAPEAIKSGGEGDCQREAGVSPTPQCLSAVGVVSPLSRAADTLSPADG